MTAFNFPLCPKCKKPMKQSLYSFGWYCNDCDVKDKIKEVKKDGREKE